MEKLYIDKGMAMHEIAKATGISTGHIHKCIHVYGIETRPQHKGFLGHHHTEEARRKISEKNIGRIFSEETRAKMSASRRITGMGHTKKRADGYRTVFFPSHPRASKEGYIMEHILIMENVIGRHLEKGEVIHHINRIRDDNRVENLQLMTVSEHMRLHTTERVRRGELRHPTSPVVNIETGTVFESVKEAAEKYGIANSNISRACRYSNRKAGGCHWAYYKERSEDLSIR